MIFSICSQAVAQRCFVKKLFLEILQNSEENTCARVSLFFNKDAGLMPATLLKKRLWHSFFPVSYFHQMIALQKL